MRSIVRAALAAALLSLPATALSEPPSDGYNDIPDKFKAPDLRDYTRTEYEIPMRDGVKLHTIVVRPKSLKGKQPIILDRTPYHVDGIFTRLATPNLAATLGGRYDTILKSGYILAFQDVRGKYGSEGTYVMNRPPVGGPLNPTKTDDSTDAYDTIDYLVKNVPDNNGRVGTIGVSYDGFTVLMSLLNPHPALKAAVPFNPMVDGWMGDDSFHHGAFREDGTISYTYNQEGSRKNETMPYPQTDGYDIYLHYGSAGAYGEALGMRQLGFWRDLLAHPAYDEFWQSQATDRVLAAHPSNVPTLLVHSLFDQEDIYGAPAVWKALKDKEPELHFVMGPWFHGGGSRGTGAIPGKITWGSDTAVTFRREVMQPFLDAHLKTDAPPANIATVTAFETGTDTWHRYKTWPLSCDRGCPYRSRALYLGPEGGLGFVRAENGAPFEEYVSDPAKPVPYIPRPVHTSDGDTWRGWLLTDQRNVASRPDVLVFESGPLTEPLHIAGVPVAHLTASTSGTDSDFVVKLIDVYPEETPENPELAGYQMMVSADIIRGRYRNDPSKPEAFVPGAPTAVTLPLPNANHVFLPGHRVMVQIQSSWFPLYDRNPQTFVPSIFNTKPSDYVKAAQRIYVTGAQASFIDLPTAPED